MIYTPRHSAGEPEFIALLEKTRLLSLNYFKNKESKSPEQFESDICELMKKCAANTSFDGKIIQTGPREFPDIVVDKYFGVEVKMTQGNHWTSTGNSILESLRIDEIERIYIFFGKFGGGYDAKFRLYQECLNEIAVTHYPRYRINMNLPKGASIFDKLGLDYDSFRRHENPIAEIKSHYREKLLKKGEALWWIDQDIDGSYSRPVIKAYSALTKDEKNNFIAETLILFPGIAGKGNTKFLLPATYLFSKYGAVSSNIRDKFSAGGRVKMLIAGENVTLPKISKLICSFAGLIKDKIHSIDEKTLKFYWNVNDLMPDRLSQWKTLIDASFADHGEKIRASEVFESADCEKN